MKRNEKYQELERHLINKRMAHTAQRFAQAIIQMANQEHINIRELEEACDIAIRYCREALVPTLQYLQTDPEN